MTQEKIEFLKNLLPLRGLRKALTTQYQTNDENEFTEHAKEIIKYEAVRIVGFVLLACAVKNIPLALTLACATDIVTAKLMTKSTHRLGLVAAHSPS